MTQVPAYNVSRTIPAEQVFAPDTRIVPFDQLVTFDLTGRRDNVLTKVINISIEGHFVTVAMSYSVRPEVQIEFGPSSGIIIFSPLSDLTLESLLDGFREALGTLSDAQKDVLEQKLLRTGFQLNPTLADRVLSQGGRSFDVDNLTQEERSRLFQAATCPDGDVHFLYSISDNATGRDFQSEPIHNIAGLGIANGDRPFRFFPQPIVFAPRSVIRVQITEISGTGRLYFVLQGYKVLGTGRQPRE